MVVASTRSDRQRFFAVRHPGREVRRGRRSRFHRPSLSRSLPS